MNEPIICEVFYGLYFHIDLYNNFYRRTYGNLCYKWWGKKISSALSLCSCDSYAL